MREGGRERLLKGDGSVPSAALAVVAGGEGEREPGGAALLGDGGGGSGVEPLSVVLGGRGGEGRGGELGVGDEGRGRRRTDVDDALEETLGLEVADGGARERTSDLGRDRAERASVRP